MQADRQSSDERPAGAAVFVTTHWSLVLAAGGDPSPPARAALEQLCRTYWYPLYAFARRRGHDPDDAQDLTQEFFRRLLLSDWIARADQSKGRFRTFLLCGLENFLANEWQKAQRIKRGHGREFVALDALNAEERYQLEPLDTASADKLFERRWALTLLERVLARLQKDMIESGDDNRFEALRSALLGEPSAEGYGGLAKQFRVSESTVKSWVRRLRQRYRELLREEVAHTVNSREEIEEELRHLVRVLAG